ncbi:MAG: GFA family protein [Paracoccaceae bacterium]
MTKLTGRCLCHAIRWETSGNPLWQAHCHCDSCRRSTASPFTSFIGMRRQDVTWTGELAAYNSSPGVTRQFCPRCGTQMSFEADQWPEETHLYAACLDDPSLYQPTAHVHWAEHVSWADLHDQLPKFPAVGGNSAPDPNAP